MAPLTDEALRRWSSIRSIVEQMPAVVAAGIDLWPGVIEVCEGIGWLVATLHDIQQNYGADIWPFVHGPATDALKLAATRSNDMAGLISTIPSVALPRAADDARRSTHHCLPAADRGSDDHRNRGADGSAARPRADGKELR